MTTSYNLKNIRRRLTEGFTAADLRAFCYDHLDFRPVYQQLTESPPSIPPSTALRTGPKGGEVGRFSPLWGELEGGNQLSEN